MRNLKRALSLALAAVMVLSMMVAGAGAVSVDDFSDGADIVNKEAVTVLASLNVINGKDDGSYCMSARTAPTAATLTAPLLAS